jgi:hypothetical protein
MCSNKVKPAGDQRINIPQEFNNLLIMNMDTFIYLDKLRALTAHLPEINEGICFGTQAFYVRKKLMMRMKEDGETLAIYTEDRDQWIAKQPAVYYFTDHYRNYPMMLVRLNKVKDKDLQQLLLTAWRMRATPKMIKDFEK